MNKEVEMKMINMSIMNERTKIASQVNMRCNSSAKQPQDTFFFCHACGFWLALMMYFSG